MRNELELAEAALAASLAGYVKAVVAIRDQEVINKLQRRFSDKEVQRKMRELLNE
ncbi:hypothetical protein [Lacipirellula sp.]|uniref:hypothetical protein n=1 Tax=Lacipirellula sp. TaxID=2691419 RepID=UPI003D098A40